LQVIFSDETHLFVRLGVQSQYVRRTSGESLRPDHLQQTVKHPDKKMFWGWTTLPSARDDEFQPIFGCLEEKSHPIELMNKFSDKTGIFQHDSAPCHKSRVVTKYLEENNVKVLDWPGNSPDLNPIENLWAILKKRLAKQDCSSKTRLIEKTIQIWYHDEEIHRICKTLVDSMPNRIKYVLKANGSHTKY